MPYKIKKVDNFYRLFNTQKKTMLKPRYKTRQSAQNVVSRYEKRKSYKRKY